jgi:formyl-CoA transferase
VNSWFAKVIRRYAEVSQGERIEVAVQDAMLQYIRVALSTQATYGMAAKRNGAKVLSGFAVPSGIYPCMLGGPSDYLYVYTSRTDPAHWQRLLEVIGRKDLIGDPRFDTGTARRLRVLAAVAGGHRQRVLHRREAWHGPDDEARQ